MSATFKNARKKLSQSELRKFMNDHKAKKKTADKINSPLAKYNEGGQLICILCQTIVRSESVWTVHINAKQHRQNVEQAKALKEKTNNFTAPGKRPTSPPNDVDAPKRLKSILKNSGSNTQPILIPPSKKKGNNKRKTNDNNEEAPATNVNEGLPSDFFDSSIEEPNKKKKKKKLKDVMDEPPVETMEEEAETLPEGFFDDPKLDAKARNIEFKDPIEEEWARFQREIKDAGHESAAIIAEDQEEATNERQIGEIEEQMKNWSRIVELEKRKVFIQQGGDIGMDVDDAEQQSSESDIDLDEFLDWRSKKSYN